MRADRENHRQQTLNRQSFLKLITAGSVVCAPSRSCLMTGLHTGHTRVRGNGSKATGQRGPLLTENTIFAEGLKAAGRIFKGKVALYLQGASFKF